MIDIKLVTSILNVEDAYRLTLTPDCGAVSMFVGITRDNFNGKKVNKLFYEAYDNMALKVMNDICTEMMKKWPQIKHIILHHRLGEVAISEASIIIAVSSPHRKDSLESVQFAIDKVKAIVPIFKKEIYDDCTCDWKENKECEWAEANKMTQLSYIGF